MLPPRVLLPLVLSVALCTATLPRDYEEIVITGGRSASGDTSSVEPLGAPSLPDLVHPGDNSVTLIDSTLYSCANTSCYYLNTKATTPAWTLFVSLPVMMFGHSAVAVGSHIWLTLNNTLYDLDTSTKHITTYQTLFEVDAYHCAVSDGKHSFILGVGHDHDEIWLSSVKYSPSQWEFVGKMTSARESFGCLWLYNYIISSGGSGASINSTELFDTVTSKSTTTGDLRTDRTGHRMCVLDRQAAVVGGEDNNGHYYNSAETYDLQTGHWSHNPHELATGRSFFGLAQFND